MDKKIYSIARNLGLKKIDVDNIISNRGLYKDGTWYGTVSIADIYKAGTKYGTVGTADLYKAGTHYSKLKRLLILQDFIRCFKSIYKPILKNWSIKFIYHNYMQLF